MAYRKIAGLKTAAQFQAYLEELKIQLPFDEAVEKAPLSPLAQSLTVEGHLLDNRFAVLPMEGWDGTEDGRPSEYTLRRWRRFGQSGASLIWGGEAVAVRMDGRANPNQLVINPRTAGELEKLRLALIHEFRQSTGSLGNPLIGLQLTHSGRYSKPYDKKKYASWLAYDHPILNPRVGLPVPSGRMISDGELERLIQDFIAAASLAQQAGFDFVDIKHCHGYLLHEFLSAACRPGKYGGSLENRARPAREIITGIQSQAPGLKIGVRLSLFDFIPFAPGADQVGAPLPLDPTAPLPFGCDPTGLNSDLSEPLDFLRMLQSWGVHLVCLTAGSPYYNPHIQRPAIFPPSDGYLPPEDPLVGVARQIQACGQVKREIPNLIVVGSAYSYLQEWLPNVAQAVVREGLADLVGLGRSVLTYPELPLDVLNGHPLQSKRLCRTFSDCTTGPRNGLISGCYPLDPFYKALPEAKVLTDLKK